VSADHVVSSRAEFPELANLLERIEAVYQPADILLFGSRARGCANAFSDWDILVVLPDDADERLLDPMIGWKTQSGSGVYADVHACLRREYLADRDVANSLAREIDGHTVGILAG
jgi:hypothetical protein